MPVGAFIIIVNSNNKLKKSSILMTNTTAKNSYCSYSNKYRKRQMKEKKWKPIKIMKTCGITICNIYF